MENTYGNKQPFTERLPSAISSHETSGVDAPFKTNPGSKSFNSWYSKSKIESQLNYSLIIS
jgi:chromosomal replication initiator protein